MVLKISRLLLITALVLVAFSGISLCRPAPARAANDWYVSTTGSDVTGNGSSGLPWQHIQFAVGNAIVLDGDTIHIAAGNYVEQVTIEKSLTLTGPSISAPYAVIVAPVARTGVIGGYDFIVNADGGHNVRLVNLIINADNTTRSAPGATSYTGVNLSNISGTGAGLSNCTILNFGGSSGNAINGVSIFGASSLTIDQCTIQDFKYYGIYSSGATSLTVSNCDINASHGKESVYVNGGSVVVDGNKITGGDYGVHTTGTSNAAISNNEVLSQAETGVWVDSGAVVIQHNVIHGINWGGGFGIQDFGGVSNGSIVNNEIYDCKRGIFIFAIFADSSWSLTQNLIHDCLFSGVYFNKPITSFSQNIIYNCNVGIDAYDVLNAHCNVILGNAGGGLYCEAGGTYNVINNYWGSNSGPRIDGSGPGTGDNIVRNGNTVNYNPWLVMQLSGTPASIPADSSSTSTIKLDCTHNSDNLTAGCTIPDGMKVHFTSTLGTLTNSTSVTSGGYATTSLRSGSTAGTADLTSAFTDAPDVTLSETQVTFTVPVTFTLKASASQNGSITPSGTLTVNNGASQTFTITANPPHMIADVLVDGNSVGAVSTYTFSNVTVNHTIAASFSLNPAFVTQSSHSSSSSASPGTQGTVSLPNIVVQSASLSASTVAPGSPVTVTARVSNRGTANGSTNIRVLVNGQEETSKGITVNAGSNNPVSFTVSRNEPGTYTVYVGGVQAGSFIVEMLPGNDGMLIFSAALVGLAFILGMVMLWRRKHTVSS